MEQNFSQKPKSAELERERAQAIFDLAMSQGGYFTTAQAEALGLRRQHFASTRVFEKVSRGIYRHTLAASASGSLSPAGGYEDFHILRLHFLRRGGDEGILFSGETAAKFLNLGDFTPTRIHALIDSSVRKTAEAPVAIDLRTVPDLSAVDAVLVPAGVMVTSPMRTLADLLTVYGVDREEVRRAYLEARGRGMITRKNVADYLPRCPPEAEHLFRTWEEEVL